MKLRTNERIFPECMLTIIKIRHSNIRANKRESREVKGRES